MESILTVAVPRAMSLMIGYKPKANSVPPRGQKQKDFRSRLRLSEAS